MANAIQVINPELILIADVVGFGNGLFTTSTRQTIENNILPHMIATIRIEFCSVEKDFLARKRRQYRRTPFLIDKACY